MVSAATLPAAIRRDDPEAPVSAGGLPVEGTILPGTTSPTPAPDGGVTPSPGPDRTNFIPDPIESSTDGSTDTALLNLQVPSEAVVYVNGRRTTTPGSLRRYISRNLKAGRDYTYEVRAEIERDGKTLSRTRVIQLTAGDNKTFEMDFDNQQQLVTSVTLFVPDDAEVTMGGVKTSARGPMRYFSTSKLQDGDSWESYRVLVTVERDGKQVQRERMIDVNAGDSVNLRFDFDTDTRVATR
jgi:uncharacterized protein (TIGR03000 family)